MSCVKTGCFAGAAWSQTCLALESHLSSLLSPTGAHIIAKFSKKLLDEDISIFSGSEMLPVVKGAFISVCRQIYATCEGLQVLLPYGLHESIAKAWKKVCVLTPPSPRRSLFQLQASPQYYCGQIFFSSQDRDSLCGPGFPGTLSVAQAGLKLRFAFLCLLSTASKGVCRHRCWRGQDILMGHASSFFWFPSSLLHPSLQSFLPFLKQDLTM